MNQGKKIRLSSFASCAGWGSKLSHKTLEQVLSKLNVHESNEMLVSSSTFDDAAVIKISDNLAMVQTVDFFPPVVDDPYLYGKISAINALSDIYCMGAKPITALNIFAVPEDLEEKHIIAILQGGNDAVEDAGAAIVGGHTIIDKEPKYGLSVTGIIDPDKVVTSSGALIGDDIILTKKIGTGIYLTAFQNDKLNDNEYEALIASMLHSNKKASEIAILHDVHAMTDVTGFGLLGHLSNVAKASKVAIRINSMNIPVFESFESLVSRDINTGGFIRNHESFDKNTFGLANMSDLVQASLLDPQTSGGLLLFVGSDKTEMVCEDLRNSGEQAFIIGKVIEKNKSLIELWDFYFNYIIV